MSIDTENPELDGAPDVELAWSEEIKRRLTEVPANLDGCYWGVNPGSPGTLSAPDCGAVNKNV